MTFLHHPFYFLITKGYRFLGFFHSHFSSSFLSKIPSPVSTHTSSFHLPQSFIQQPPLYLYVQMCVIFIFYIIINCIINLCMYIFLASSELDSKFFCIFCWLPNLTCSTHCTLLMAATEAWNLLRGEEEGVRERAECRRRDSEIDLVGLLLLFTAEVCPVVPFFSLKVYQTAWEPPLESWGLVILFFVSSQLLIPYESS